jgi:hypothetical protein
MKIATLSRKEVKTRLHVTDFILKRLLLEAGCTDVLQKPDTRIFPLKSWQPLFDHIGVDMEASTGVHERLQPI